MKIYRLTGWPWRYNIEFAFCTLGDGLIRLFTCGFYASSLISDCARRAMLRHIEALQKEEARTAEGVKHDTSG